MNNFKSILLLFFISISLLASSGFIYATQVDVFPITTSLTSFQSYLKSYSIQASDKSYIINTWEFEGLDSDEYKASLYLVSETTGAKGVLVSNIPTNIKRFDWEVSAFMKTTAHGPRDTEVLPGVYRMRLELTDTQGEIQWLSVSKAFEIQRASGYALALNEAYKTSDSYILDNQARYIVNTWNLDKDIPHSYKTNLYLVSSKTGKQGVLVTNVNQNQPQRFDWKITSAIPTIPGGLKNMAINSGEYYVRAELVNDAGEIIDFDRSQDFRITNMVSSSELIAISNREEYQKKYSVTAEFTPHIINTWDLGSSVNEEYRTDIYLLSEKTKQKGVLVTNVHPLHTQRFDWKIKKTLPTVVNGAKNMAITDGLYSILVELKDENGSIVATDQSDLFEIDQIETPKVTFTSADSYLRDYQSGVFDLESEMIINDSIFNAWNFNQIIPDEYRTQLILVSENTQERGFILGNIKPKDKQYTWKISSFLRRTINGASDLPVFSGDYRMRIEILDENGAVISFDQSPIFTITQSNDFSVSLQESSYASKYVTDIDKDIYVINKWDFGRPIPANYHTNLWLVSETSGTRGLLIQNIRYKNKRFDWKIDNYIRSWIGLPKDMPIPSGDYRIQIELVNDKQTVVATDLGRSFRIQRPETNKVSFSKIDSYQQEYTTQNGDIISNQWTFSKPLESDQRFRLKIVSEQTGNTGVLVTNILPYNNRFDWKVADSARTNQGENQTLALEPGSYRMSIELIDKHGSVLNSDKSPIFTIDEKLLSQKYIKLKAHQSWIDQYDVTSDKPNYVVTQWDTQGLEETDRVWVYLVSEQTGERGLLVSNVQYPNARFDWRVESQIKTIPNGKKDFFVWNGNYRIRVELRDEMGKVISSDESKNTIQIINSQTTVAIDILDSVVYGKSYYETPGFKNKLNFSWDIQNIPPENSLISLWLKSVKTGEIFIIKEGLSIETTQYTWDISSPLPSGTLIPSDSYQLHVEINTPRNEYVASSLSSKPIGIWRQDDIECKEWVAKIPVFMVVISGRIPSDSEYERLANCARHIVLEAPVYPIDWTPSFAEHVERFKSYNPDVKVLMYTWATYWIGFWDFENNLPKENEYRQSTMSTYLWSPLLNKPEWMLSGRRWNHSSWEMPTHWDLPANEQRILYPDPRNQEFRDWMVNRINSLFREVGTDGVLIDMMFQKPTYGGTIANTWCQYDKVRCDEYSQGVLDLMQQLKQEVNGEVFMNPLATKFDKGADTDITAEDQIEILRKIDGINIEHFGLSRVGDSPSERNYYKDILYYIKAAQENPDRYFAFNARENWDNFDSIDEAIENGKFLYANYLLGAGANTGFKYHSLFMMIDLPHPSLISGAIGKTFTDGRFILPEQLIPTGNALESFQENGELRTRTFENVFTAVLSPDATQPVIIELPKDYKKDILGMEYAWSYILNPGDYILLFRDI